MERFESDRYAGMKGIPYIRMTQDELKEEVASWRTAHDSGFQHESIDSARQDRALFLLEQLFRKVIIPRR